MMIAFIPNAFAKDFTINSECIDGSWTATVLDEDGNPLENVSVRTIPAIASTKIETKFVTDENGVVSITPENNIGFGWFSKGGYSDKKIPTECEINQQPVVQYSNLGKTNQIYFHENVIYRVRTLLGCRR